MITVKITPSHSVTLFFMIAAFISPCALAPHAEEKTLDNGLTPYTTIDGVSGTLSSIGSDTLNNLMTFWAEGFHKCYPNVAMQVEGKGSSTAPPALAENTAQLGPMSRKMKREEIELFKAKHGYEPTAIGVALDAVAFYVHRDNPLVDISIPQLDAIFSATRLNKHAKDITQWGDLGLAGPWAMRPISLYGRNSASGTYSFIKEHVLNKGDFKDIVKEQPGSASVVMGVSEDMAGIGYSGVGYKTSGVKALNLSLKDGEPAIAPTNENVLAGTYPVSRMLLIYIAKEPGKPLSPLVREFLRYTLSREGQTMVLKDGYIPLPASIVEKQLALLD